MSEVTRFSSEIKKNNMCIAYVDLSMQIRLYERQAKYILTVTEDGCLIERVNE